MLRVAQDIPTTATGRHSQIELSACRCSAGLGLGNQILQPRLKRRQVTDHLQAYALLPKQTTSAPRACTNNRISSRDFIGWPTPVELKAK